MNENFYLKLIAVIAIAFSFVVNSIMFTWEATRRPADVRTTIQKNFEECIDFSSANEVAECDKFKERINK